MEEKLERDFGLEMEDLELFGQQYRDGMTRYSCDKEGHEGILYVWSMFSKEWSKGDVTKPFALG